MYPRSSRAFFSAAFAQVVGRLEQALAELAGYRIDLRPPASLEGAGLATPFKALADPVRWRYVGFVVINLVLAPVLLAFGSFPLSLVVQAVFDIG